MDDPVGLEVREYQNSIAESAVSSNTLVVLPTGLGKTVVALLVARRRLSAYPDGKVLVLAPTRPLVGQHAEFFKKHLPNVGTVAVLTGEASPDLRIALFQESKLIFATPEVIRNDVARRRYSLRDICLLVFDEAHRCVKNYAYSQVAEAYRRVASSPLILALTASPGAKKSRIDEICEKLAITNIQARTEGDADVSGYVKPVIVKWERIPLPPIYREISRILREALDEKVEKLRRMRRLPFGVLVTKGMLLDLGERLRGELAKGRSGFIFAAILLQSQTISLQHAIELLETQGIHSLHQFLSRLNEGRNKSARSLSKDPRIVEALQLSESHLNEGHPKQSRLKELIAEQLQEKGDSKLIVFTQFRDTVDSTIRNLSKVSEVSAVRFVGQATRSMDDVGLRQSEQMRILEDFRSGRFNTLVTTSIGEEGLHVPDVDHVIFYEAIPSEIRSIQRRGRTGRTRIGRVTVLMAEGTIDESYYWSSRRKEAKMQRLLEGAKRQTVRPKRRKVTLLDYLNQRPSHP